MKLLTFRQEKDDRLQCQRINPEHFSRQNIEKKIWISVSFQAYAVFPQDKDSLFMEDIYPSSKRSDLKGTRYWLAFQRHLQFH
jgi:hypothetical protein